MVLGISLGIEVVNVFVRFLPLVGGRVRRLATGDEIRCATGLFQSSSSPSCLSLD